MGGAGIVFNLQRFSLHDGPGIRTVVFLKGCPLACRWCSNPESQAAHPELAFHREACLGAAACGRCLAACAPAALRAAGGGRIVLDRKRCTGCMACAAACPPQALRVYGEAMTAAACLDIVEQDAPFYARSGGGITLSGGEPLHQAPFALALLEEARRRRIHRVMETCGEGRFEDLAAACGLLDGLIYDVKLMDAARHRRVTGRSNARILDNLGRIRAAFPRLPLCVRTPLVPGVNDRAAEIRPILEHVRRIPGASFELLDYHRLGRPKYVDLGRRPPLGDRTLDPRRAAGIRRLIAAEFPELAGGAPA
jgi:pyruvate formate lyase activating enzyme